MRIALWTYRLLFWGGLAILFLGVAAGAGIGELAGSQAPGSVMGGIFGFWLLFGRRISLWLLPVFVTRIRCPGCKDEHDPRGVWNCGCGYHDHKERNVLSYTCPACGGQIGRFNCPSCEATILLW